MQKNYTNPEESEQDQNPQDLLNGLLIFANALGLILKQGQGIVIDVKGDVKLPEMNKVIVYKNNERIHITNCKENFEEGSVVEVDLSEENDKTE